METVQVVPVCYVPSGTHQRLIGLSVVKTITFAANQQAIYLQALVQNIRMTTDGTAPAFLVNPTGFQLRAGDPPVRLDFAPGTVLKFIEEAASATLQYQMLTLAPHYP